VVAADVLDQPRPPMGAVPAEEAMSVRMVPADELVPLVMSGWELVDWQWVGRRCFAVVMRRGIVEVRA
jgi:hypothetical protein